MDVCQCAPIDRSSLNAGSLANAEFRAEANHVVALDMLRLLVDSKQLLHLARGVTLSRSFDAAPVPSILVTKDVQGRMADTHQ